VIKYLVVPSTGAHSDAPVFETALGVARVSGAHLEFLHVRVDPQRVMAAMSSDYGGIGMGAATGMDEVMDTMQRGADRAEEQAHAAFHAFCAREGLPLGGLGSAPSCTAEWHCEVGEAATLLARHGRAADLIVLGREGSEGRIATDLLQDVLLQAGRPLLLVPSGPARPVFDTVVVAWKDTPEAARAVAAATPFIEGAERVVVCTVDEGEQDHGTEACEASRERLARALSWHNPQVTSQRLASGGCKPVNTLLDAAAAAGASLLVMGGYGHNRLREAVFGGFTQRVLEDCDLPVLITH
jgi:nucleotide-binding universal stress UspA family protein